ncbi:MAG TPA: glycosyltransferase family 9 protein, partial [Pirellulales bacterium]|nr:glycosyltransferase family 9 protein [Pirellulales bacterium]
MKIGIFIPNWIGDAAMATPALRALSRHYGAGAELIGILRPYVADVLAGTPWLTDQIFYHPKSKNPAERTWSVLGQLRKRRLDAVILLTNSLRAGALAWASGARQRVGYVRYGRSPLLTHKLYPPRHGRKYLPTPAIDAYLQLASGAGCEWESPRLELATLPADEAAADA